MNSQRLPISKQYAWLCCIGLALVTPVAARADDPLEAFPTDEFPAEARVEALSEEHRGQLKLPQSADQAAICISMVQSSKPGDKQSATEAKPPEPWLRVFADGKIEARPETNRDAPLCRDRLTKSELTWLLHLAVNECQLFGRTSQQIDAAIAKLKQQRPANARRANSSHAIPDNHYQYDVNLPAGSTQLLIPESALTLRPLRARLDLGAFASLNHYARFLAARTCLGNEAERRAILDQVNAELLLQDKGATLFKLEDLGAAGQQFGMFVAVFQQEVELGENSYRRVTGSYVRKDPASDPKITINVMDFSRARPR